MLARSVAVVTSSSPGGASAVASSSRAIASEYSASASANSVGDSPPRAPPGSVVSPSRVPIQASDDATSTSTAAAAAGWNQAPQPVDHAPGRSSFDMRRPAAGGSITRARTAAHTAGGGVIGSSVRAVARIARTSAASRPARRARRQVRVDGRSAHRILSVGEESVEHIVQRSGELRAGQGRVVSHHTVSSAPRGTAPRPRSSTRSFIRALCTCDFDVPSEMPSAAPTSR